MTGLGILGMICRLDILCLFCSMPSVSGWILDKFGF